MHFLLALLLAVSQVPKQKQRELRGERLKGSFFGAADSIAVHGNTIGKRITFRAQPKDGSEPNVVPDIASKPTDPMFDRDDIRDAALKAWNSSSAGQKESEYGFWIKGGAPNIRLQEHPYGNQRLEITDTMPPNATAEVHVHPNKGVPDPSDNDKSVADKHRIDVYTISRKGVYAYRPSRKTTEFLGTLDEFGITKKTNK